jgi:molecular chaperone Hsp33
MSELHKFLFDGLPVRGMLVRLTDSWQEVLARRAEADAWPPEVASLVGQMCAAGVLMQSNIKFAGALVLQVSGDGPVKLAVAEVQPNLRFRGTAKVVGEVPAGARLAAMVNLHGQGRCAITLDPHDRKPGQQPYQGVVALHGDRGEPLQQLAEVLEHYMLQSEQLDTRLVLAADQRIAAGLLIQRLPVEGEGNLGGRRNEDDIGISEDFNRIAHLAATLTADELLTLDADTVLRRLFWEEKLLRFDIQTPRFACTCSRERVASMIRALGQEEAQSILEDHGEIDVGCDFCGQQYRFDAVDATRIFADPGDQPPVSPTVQ